MMCFLRLKIMIYSIITSPLSQKNLPSSLNEKIFINFKKVIILLREHEQKGLLFFVVKACSNRHEMSGIFESQVSNFSLLLMAGSKKRK